MADITLQIQEISQELTQHLSEAAATADRISTEVDGLAGNAAEIFSTISEPSSELTSFAMETENQATAIWAKGQQDIEEAADNVAAQFTKLSQLVQETIQQASSLIVDWNGLENNLIEMRSAFQAFTTAELDAETANWIEQANLTKASLQRQADLFEALGSDLQNTGEQVSTTLSTVLGEWWDEHASSIDQFGTQQTQNSESAFEEISSALTSAYEAETNRIESIQSNLMESIETASSSWVDEQKDKFIEALEDIVKREIAEAIIVSQFGAATTGVLSPYIPALAVVKNGADTLLELIRTWKELKEPFGL